MSSGVVSQRTRMTASPALPRSSAVSASSTIAPDAAPGRGVEPARGNLDRRVGVDHRVQKLVELAGIDAGDRLLARDEALVDHLRRDARRSRGRALAGSRLQEVERPLLDRELDVLQVAVVRLEPVERVDELLERLRHALAHPVDRLGRADARHDVLALRVRRGTRRRAAARPSPGRA